MTLFDPRSLNYLSSAQTWEKMAERLRVMFEALHPYVRAHRSYTKKLHTDYRRKKGGRW